MKTKKLTRAQAERLVVRTSDEATLLELAKHKNPHVAHKVRFKLLAPADRRNATGMKNLSALLQAIDTAGAESRASDG